MSRGRRPVVNDARGRRVALAVRPLPGALTDELKTRPTLPRPAIEAIDASLRLERSGYAWSWTILTGGIAVAVMLAGVLYGGGELGWIDEACILIAAGLLLTGAITAMVRHDHRAPDSLVSRCLQWGLCPACLESLGGIAPADDACTVCSMCHAAWRPVRVCPDCGYDLGGLREVRDSIRCPECGAAWRLTGDGRDG